MAVSRSISDYLAEDPTLPSVPPMPLGGTVANPEDSGDYVGPATPPGVSLSARGLSASGPDAGRVVGTDGERRTVVVSDQQPRRLDSPRDRAGRSGSAVDPWLGRVLPGGYRLEALLESGASSRTYRATQHGERGGRLSRVKVLLNPALRDAEARRRFRDWARAASQIQHPHILGVYGFGRTEDGTCFLTTELVEGVTLRRLLDGDQRGAATLLPPRRALGIFLQIVAGLAAAHAQGLAHGDLRMESVLLSEARSGAQGALDEARVCDFGCAALALQPDDGEPLLRKDVAALGRILYELCCGQAPIQGPRWRVPLPLASLAPGRRFSPALESLLRAMLAVDPAQRPADAGEVLARLQDLTQPAGTSRGAMPPVIEEIGEPGVLVSGRLPMGPGDDTTGPVGRAWPLREISQWGFAALSVGLFLAGLTHSLRSPTERPPTLPEQLAPSASAAPILWVPPTKDLPASEPAPSGIQLRRYAGNIPPLRSEAAARRRHHHRPQ